MGSEMCIRDRSSSIPCKVEWFETPEALMSALDDLDLVIVDRKLGGIDVFESGAIEKLAKVFGGPLVLSSMSTPTRDEKRFFRKVLYNKRPISISSLKKIALS